MFKNSVQLANNQCKVQCISPGHSSTAQQLNRLLFDKPVYLGVVMRYFSVGYAQRFTQKFTAIWPLFEHYLYSLSTAPTIYITNLKKESI